MNKPILQHIIVDGLSIEDRQRIARHWILMRTNAKWN